jgi:hypothetical protein
VVVHGKRIQKSQDGIMDLLKEVVLRGEKMGKREA